MQDYLSLREIQLEELEILKKVVNYIEEKNLRYYLCGGTLLGAIRHKGFIPWDDDIDIAMPRKDYDTFMEYSKNDAIDDDYEVASLNNGNYNRPFGKVLNKNIPIKSKSLEDKYLWIDIFPLDGLPNSMEESKKTIKKCKLLKGQIYLRTTTCKEILNENRSILNKVAKLILKPFTYRHSILYYGKKIDRIARKHDFDISDKVGNVVWTEGERTIFKKDWFIDTIDGEFEKQIFNIPINSNEYLKQAYGDYMKLPLETERIDHKIRARKLKITKK